MVFFRGGGTEGSWYDGDKECVLTSKEISEEPLMGICTCSLTQAGAF